MVVSNGVLLGGLAILATFTSLVVEGVKKLLDEKGKTYSSNLLAVIVSVVSTLIVSILYIVYKSIPFSAQVVVIIIALMIFSFLTSTVGYDKVKQLIEQMGKKWLWVGGDTVKDTEIEVKEELRRFLIYDLQISPLNIDRIDVDRMRDGQLRNINISFIPSIRGRNND